MERKERGQQKRNTKRFAEAELTGKDDYIASILGARYFIKAQGCTYCEIYFL